MKLKLFFVIFWMFDQNSLVWTWLSRGGLGLCTTVRDKLPICTTILSIAASVSTKRCLSWSISMSPAASGCVQHVQHITTPNSETFDSRALDGSFLFFSFNFLSRVPVILLVSPCDFDFFASYNSLRCLFRLIRSRVHSGSRNNTRSEYETPVSDGTSHYKAMNWRGLENFAMVKWVLHFLNNLYNLLRICWL